MISKQSPTASHDSPASAQPVAPGHGPARRPREMHEPDTVTGWASPSGRTAQALFWRLPYRLRQRVFRQFRPALAAYYERMLHGQAGAYSLVPMLERGCLFVHIPKCAGVAVSHALFGMFGTANHCHARTTPPRQSVHSMLVA